MNNLHRFSSLSARLFSRETKPRVKGRAATWPYASLLALLSLAAAAVGAETSKPKLLEAFHNVDAKTMDIFELKAKPVTTKDPSHQKGLEVIADFAKPNTWPHLYKRLPQHVVSPQKYTGFRFSAKSDTSTRVNFEIRGSKPVKEGRQPAYTFEVQLAPEWKEFTVNFSDLKSWQQKVYKDGKQIIFPAGEPVQDTDWELFDRCGISFDVVKRGTGTSAHAVIENLVLLPK